MPIRPFEASTCDIAPFITVCCSIQRGNVAMCCERDRRFLNGLAARATSRWRSASGSWNLLQQARKSFRGLVSSKCDYGPSRRFASVFLRRPSGPTTLSVEGFSASCLNRRDLDLMRPLIAASFTIQLYARVRTRMPWAHQRRRPSVYINSKRVRAGELRVLHVSPYFRLPAVWRPPV